MADYRTNPYVLMTAASVMNLDDPKDFGKFLFDSKLYMALETSFGKSIESRVVRTYPLRCAVPWSDPPEKIREFQELVGIPDEEKARRRRNSVWREVDRSSVVGNKRYLTSIKSGPNTINDTQVQGMTDAILANSHAWLAATAQTYPGVEELDVVLGLTYGTDRTTNNKENQILAKLIDSGFHEEDRALKPGILIESKTRKVRVYRRIGKDFWSFIGQPDDPSSASFVFLEVLLSLARALAIAVQDGGLEERINAKLDQLATALTTLRFERASLPEWVRADFSEDELFWFASALTPFFDEGI
ncbi:MAG: PmeII family type II restriction endonuclease [Bauldia sp.]